MRQEDRTNEQIYADKIPLEPGIYKLIKISFWLIMLISFFRGLTWTVYIL